MNNKTYYIPHGTYWPIIGSIGITLLFVGLANQMHGVGWGLSVMLLGLAIIIFMLFGWFGKVVNESVNGFYNKQVDKTFRWGMSWFIFSEVMFFAAFFGALLYSRVISVSWLGGGGNNMFSGATEALDMTKYIWEGFQSAWPLINTPGEVGQNGVEFSTGFHPVNTWGLPLINTALLLTSSVTITLAHHAIRDDKRNILIFWMILTIALGITFLGFQIAEYGHAYHEGLKLSSGIYGSTFYLLTGFHGFHVTLGTIMIAVILYRIQKGHFNSDNHFAFEAVAWYWHFVDVVWLGLFIFVYWI